MGKRARFRRRGRTKALTRRLLRRIFRFIRERNFPYMKRLIDDTLGI